MILQGTAIYKALYYLLSGKKSLIHKLEIIWASIH